MVLVKFCGNKEKIEEEERIKFQIKDAIDNFSKIDIVILKNNCNKIREKLINLFKRCEQSGKIPNIRSTYGESILELQNPFEFKPLPKIIKIYLKNGESEYAAYQTDETITVYIDSFDNDFKWRKENNLEIEYKMYTPLDNFYRLLKGEKLEENGRKNLYIKEVIYHELLHICGDIYILKSDGEQHTNGILRHNTIGISIINMMSNYSTNIIDI